MKTIRQWLNELPMPERDKAFRHEQYWWSDIEFAEPSLIRAVNNAFTWHDSRERHEYWSGIADRYKK